jgi:thiosulfate/3-mercaptopyruvate sulfurtransferase
MALASERMGSPDPGTAPSSPIVSVDELAGRLAAPNLVVVDARWYLGRPGAGREAYLSGHLPGAIFLDLDDDLSDPNGFGAPGRHPLPDAAMFAQRTAAAGIGDGSEVVGYDDAGGWVAARLWWMLDNLGFGRRGIAGESVRVLDGGIAAWVAAGRPLSTGAVTRPPARLELRDRWHGIIERDALRERLGSLTLLDARGAARYRGEVEPVDPVAGHIPTALSAPFEGNLGPDGRLLAPAALRGRFAALGIDDDAGLGRDVVTSCGSGTSACHHSLAMRIAGLPDPILYVGSYSDWSRSGEAIATGPEPGRPGRPSAPAPREGMR